MKSVIRITIALLSVFSIAARAQETSATDQLDTIVAAVRKVDPNKKYEGRLYEYTTGNRFVEVLQTPNAWGKQPEHLDWGQSNKFAESIGALIETAQSSVDISTLYPAPDGYFAATITDGLKTLARSGRPVTVRILVGHYVAPYFDAKGYLANLRAALGGIAGSKLTIYAAGAQTAAISWNHSKIVAVDGRSAIVGGHNLWPVDYLGPRPVHDLSMRISGPAARASHSFLDTLWKNVCDMNGKPIVQIYSYKWQAGSNDIVQQCKADMPLLSPVTAGTTRMFGVGRAASGVVPDGGNLANPADVAILAAFDSARHTIRISQQDLGVVGVVNANTTAIARALARDVLVAIVLTTPFATAGNNNTPYSTGTTLDATRLAIFSELTAQVGPIEAKKKIRKLQLVSIKFGPGTKWPSGASFANHAKMFIIDENVFYIGSHNLYPSDLQEFGYFVGHPEATRALITQYWDPLWQWSTR